LIRHGISVQPGQSLWSVAKFHGPKLINAQKNDAAAFWLHFTVSVPDGRRYTSTGLHGYLNC